MTSRPALACLLLLSTLSAARLSAQVIEAPTPAATTAAADASTDAKPLPNLQALLDQAKAHADASMEIRKNYACKQTVISDEFDSKGTKKGTHTDEYQMYYVQKHEISQHVSHDGQPLSPDAAKKEQERIDKLTAEIKAGTLKPGNNSIIRVSHLIKLAIISDPRREIVNGRPTIFFDYRGNPDARADGLPDEVMKKLTGTIELDEADAAVIHLTGTLMENFHIMGGMLVNLKKGSHFELSQTRVNDELWFTKLFVGHVDGKILLFKGFDGDIHAEFSDYRKMTTTATILPGSQIIGDDGKPVATPPPDTAPRP